MRRRIAILLSGVFALAACAVAWRMIGVPKQAPAAESLVEDRPDAVAIRSANFATVDKLGGPGAFSASIRSAIEREARAAGLSATQARSLATYASERVRMLLEEDYDAYRADMERLFGAPASSIDIPFVSDPQRWRVLTKKFSSAPLSADAVLVRTWVDDGANARGSPIGHYGFLATPAPLRALLGNVRSPKVADVYVPMRVEEVHVPQIGSGGRTLDCFVVLSFAWDESRNRWTPWRAGVFEPAGVGKVLPNPWI